MSYIDGAFSQVYDNNNVYIHLVTTMFIPTYARTLMFIQLLYFKRPRTSIVAGHTHPFTNVHLHCILYFHLSFPFCFIEFMILLRSDKIR